MQSSKFESAEAWRKKQPFAYRLAIVYGRLEEICKQFGWKIPENIEWTFEMCLDIAKQYNSRGEWQRHDKRSYSAAYRHGWLDQCTKHMTVILRSKHYWTKERCMASAARFSTRQEWLEADNSAILAARRRGWFNECCAHMSRLSTRWTKEQCMTSAKQYKTRKDWMRHELKLYVSATNNGWLDECCAHMVLLRKKKWTKPECIESAKRFMSKTEWKNGDLTAYQSANRNGWLDECCSHMKILRRNAWTKEECIADAKKYHTKKEWNQSSSAAQIAAKNGWLDECCAHMIKLQTPKGYWTLERCKASASIFSTKSAWERGDQRAYQAACKKGWLNQCCGHMQQLKKPNGYWSLERCIESASKFTIRKEWEKNCPSAYAAATSNGWHNICSRHMLPAERPIYWTKERCIEEARKYSTLKEWGTKSASSYAIALRRKWKDECAAHMKKFKSDSWTLERCIEKAKSFERITEWSLKSSSSYCTAWRNGWLDQCCAHMKQKPRSKRTPK